MSDLLKAAGKLDPAERRVRRLHLELRRLIGRHQRIERKDVLDVHQDQFLVLLLMLHPEFDQRCDLAPSRLFGTFDHPRHRGTDMIAIGHDDIDSGARQQAAFRPRVSWADRLVIGIEEVGKGRVEHSVIRIKTRQDKRFEKPGSMGEVPFCRAGIGHRLDRLVLWRQIGGQRFGVAPYGLEPFERCLAISAIDFILCSKFEHNVPQAGCIVPLTPRSPGCSLVQITIAQMPLEARRSERPAGGGLDEFRRRQQRSLRMNALTQPAEQRREFAGCDCLH